MKQQSDASARCNSDMFFQAFTAISLGVLAHHGIFIRGEWHLQAPAVVVVHAVLTALMGGIAAWKYPSERYDSIQLAIGLFFCYLGGLFSSIVIYRLRFHRLRHFPGPRLAAVSKLWHVYQCRDSRNHLVLESMRKKFGTFVRTGE